MAPGAVGDRRTIPLRPAGQQITSTTGLKGTGHLLGHALNVSPVNSTATDGGAEPRSPPLPPAWSTTASAVCASSLPRLKAATKAGEHDAIGSTEGCAQL